MIDNDPLWRLRHALIGMALALMLSVPVAALAGSWIADRFADSYGLRVAVYSALLVYVIVGAVLLFKRVAQHETQRISARRLALWLASLWLWPVLLLGRKPAAPPPA